MRYPKRLKKTGKPGQARGVRLKRKMKFQPVLETSSGIPVRSKLERACVDWLNARNINFQYEPLILIEGRQFRPDFYLTDHDIFLEICGYNHMPYYRDRIKQKKHLYDKFGMNSIFIDCRNIRDLEKTLNTEFTHMGLLNRIEKGD